MSLFQSAQISSSKVCEQELLPGELLLDKLLSKDSSLPKDLLGESETWQVISKSEPTNLHTNNKVNIEDIIENGDLM